MALNDPLTDLASTTASVASDLRGKCHQAINTIKPATRKPWVSGASIASLTAIILDRAAELFAVTVAELRGPRRTPDLAQARFAAAYVLHRRYPAITLRALGEALGGRDRSTIVYALRRAEELAECDPDYSARLQALLDEPSAPVAHGPPAPIALLGRPWLQLSHYDLGAGPHLSGEVTHDT